MPPYITELLNYILGSTTIVAGLVAWKSRKSAIKQNEATALESFDSMYNKVTATLEKELNKMIVKIETQDRTILEMEKRLSDYITQCTECPNNKIKK